MGRAEAKPINPMRGSMMGFAARLGKNLIKFGEGRYDSA